MPYSFGKPALNCCGGSLRTLGNMNRPVAASAAADAAENAPQASPIQARRVRSGDVSSGSRVIAGAAGAAALADGAAAVVVLPCRSGIGAGAGLGAAGLAACGVAPAPAPAPATTATAGAAAAGFGTDGGAAAGFAPADGAVGRVPALLSSAIRSIPRSHEMVRGDLVNYFTIEPLTRQFTNFFALAPSPAPDSFDS